MNNRRGVLLDLTGPVAVLAQDFYDWKVANTAHPERISQPYVLIETGFFDAFIELMLYEIFKEHHHSEYIDVDAPATVFLRNFGMPEEMILRLKCDFLNSVIAIIYRVLPDIYFAEVERCDYNMTDRRTLLIFIHEDANAPMALLATPPPSVL